VVWKTSSKEEADMCSVKKQKAENAKA